MADAALALADNNVAQDTGPALQPPAQPPSPQPSPYTQGDDWEVSGPPAPKALSPDEFSDVPKITDTPLYKAGERIQQWGKRTFPVTEEERQAHPHASAIGRAERLVPLR
jgi:hypothetical protein